MRVIIATICQKHLRYPRVILASKLSLIIFIGLCGLVELLIVRSYVIQLVGLSVDGVPELLKFNIAFLI